MDLAKRAKQIYSYLWESKGNHQLRKTLSSNLKRLFYSFYSLISNPMRLDVKCKGQSEMLSREVMHMDRDKRMYVD